jgi:hypothetical protein
MTDVPAVVNPFRVWEGVARGLRDRFVAELATPPASRTPHADTFAGSLSALLRNLDRLGEQFNTLQRTDREAFAAFLRAMEKT